MKECKKCHQIKPFMEFGFQRATCKQCRSQQQKLYRETHQEKIKLLWKNWQEKNKKKRKIDWDNWYKRNQDKVLIYKKTRRLFFKKNKPWLIVLQNIRCRLTSSKSKIGSISKYKKNKTYRLIKNYLTEKDLKFLWFRDKAFKMRKPSIHRKNNKKHYTLRNCEFLEFFAHNRLKKER